MNSSSIAAERIPVRTAVLVLLTSLFFCIGPLTVDFSLPALAAIQSDIGNANSHAELTLTAIFFGMALGQFVFGAIADRFGRRWPLLLSIAVYVLASLWAATSTQILEFGLARLSQALGYGVAVAVGRSVAVDVCDERTTAKVFSSAITMMSLVSVLGPAAGGQILDHFGWRAIFVVMALTGALTVAAVAVWLPETLPAQRRSKVGFSKVLATYGSLLRSRRFTTFAITGAAAVACQFTYNTAAPSVLIEHFGMNPTRCGLLLSTIAVSMALASQLNAVMLKWYPAERIIAMAVKTALASSAVLLICVLTGAGGLLTFTASLFVLVATIGFTAGNTMAAAISSVGAQAGAGSALLGVMQFVLGTVGSAVVGLFHDASGRVMATIIALFALLGVLMAFATSKR